MSQPTRDISIAITISLQSESVVQTGLKLCSPISIAKVKVYGRRDLVTVVGNFMAPMPGEILKMRGEWANHPKFGEQFKVRQYKSLVPASVAGIEKYLECGISEVIGTGYCKKDCEKV